MTESDAAMSAAAARLLSGAPVSAVAVETGLSEAALVAWRQETLERFAQLRGRQAAVPALRLHHVGIVARDDEQIRRFAERLHLIEVKREYLPKYRVTNVFLSTGRGAQIQFMLPESGMLKNFNAGRGGLHHIAFLAENITPVQRALEAEGVRFIAAEKQAGIGGFRFNFVLPHLEGISVELIEDPDADP